MTEFTEFATVIKAAAKLRKMTVAELAKRTDTTPTHLYTYLGDKGGISATLLGKLFDELGIVCTLKL